MDSVAAEIISNYNVIRQRLRNPPNAVIDRGIDLRRNRIPPEPLPECLTKALEYPDKTECKVTILEIPKSPIKPIPGSRVRIAAIERVCCQHFGITEKDLHGPSRVRPLIYQRHIYYYLCRRLTTHSLPGIAHHGGRPRLVVRKGKIVTVYGRDHTCIIHACRKIAELILVDEATAATVKFLEATLLEAANDAKNNLSEPAVAAEPKLDLAQEQPPNAGSLHQQGI